MRALKGFKRVMALAAICLAVLLMQDSVQEESVEFITSPEQTIADSFTCEPTPEGAFPSTVIVLPEGEAEPVQSAELVGPALEQTFNNGPYIGVVMGFCK